MAEEKSPNRGTRRYIEYAMVALAVLLAVLVVIGVFDYRAARRSFIATHQHHGPLTAADASYVRTWMTFDYINRLFKLPPDYLSTQLMITDSQYPKLTVSTYASRNHLNSTMFLSTLDDAIRSYLTSTATSTTP